ncbi:MAG: hypothetical protein GF330_07640 [Candidatus Eisenbacteria bacterium]|nr:hypothetical protein [Candidatus Eisenbacteria bacterium]
MTHYSITVTRSAVDGMHVAICPTLGGLSALGSTARDAVAELEEVIALALET